MFLSYTAKAYYLLFISLLTLHPLPAARRLLDKWGCLYNKLAQRKLISRQQAIIVNGGSLIDCSRKCIVEDYIAKSLTPACKLVRLSTYLKLIEQLPDKILVQEINFSGNCLHLEGATQVLNKVKTWKQKEFKNLEKLDLSWTDMHTYSYFPEYAKAFDRALAAVLKCDICVDIRGNAVATASWARDFLAISELQDESKLLWETDEDYLASYWS